MKTAEHAALVGLMALLAGLFALSVAARQDRFGDLQGRGHEWLTGSAVKFTRNWYREGAWNLRFAMLENPRSIEFPDLLSREAYVSYPPGCLMRILAVSRVMHREPSAAMVMAVNLAGQLVGALLVFALLFGTLGDLGLGFAARAILAALGFLQFVFLPGPFYWFQNVYFSDQGIVPIVIAAVLLEVVNDRAPRRAWTALQSLVVAIGVFTDWFMVPVAAMLVAKRWFGTWGGEPAAARLRRAALFLLPSALALVLFLIQVTSLGGFASLQRKLLNRTGLAPGTSWHFTQIVDRYWTTYVPGNFGSALAPWLLVFSAAGFLALAWTRRGRGGDAPERRALWLGGLLLIPAAFHTLVFWQHAVDHSFSPLRLLPAFACLPFGVAPLLVARRLGWAGRPRAALVAAVTTIGLLHLIAGQGSMAGVERARRPEIPALGASLARLTAFEDVVFSPDFEVPANPPEVLAYSMKRVYRVASPDSLASRVDALPAGARVRLVFLRDPDPSWARMLTGLTPRDDGMVRAFDLGRARDLRSGAQRTRTSDRVIRTPPTSARTK